MCSSWGRQGGWGRRWKALLVLQGEVDAQGKAEAMHIYQVYMAVPAHGGSWEVSVRSTKTTMHIAFHSIFRMHNPSDTPFGAQQ